MVALVGVALAAVTLVGLGVLLLAQFGARQEARERVLDQLGVLADLADSGGPAGSIDRFGPALGRIGEAFEASDVAYVVIDDDGHVRSARLNGRDHLILSSADLADLESGPIVVDRRGSVVGIARIDVRLQRGALADEPLAVLVQRDVVSVAPEARAWFLLSAGAVVLLSLAVAGWLSSRFTRPLQAIEVATVRIAAGDLDARVEVTGNDELAELGRAVNRMAADLGRSRAAEQEFLMSVSHDLRTPLTAITGYAEALTDGAIDDPAVAGTVIAGNAQRLSRLVCDLLDLARLNTNQFRFEPQLINAAEVASNVVDDHAPRASAYGVALGSLGVEAAPVVADADRLAQAIGNLIDNALKFARTTVDVEVTVASNEVSISVSDDGPGIPPKDVPFVFERLYVTRLRPVRAENSSGLGLAIVKELASAMGGSASVNSEVGVGTTMTLRLPLAPT